MGSQKHTIIKSNALLEARYNFSLLEIKLLLSVISQIKREDKDFQCYRVYLNDFTDIIDKKGIKYEHLRNTARSLKAKVIEIETETGHLITNYVSDIQLYKNDGYIDFYVSKLLKPYLLELKSNFTIYDIRNVIQCGSAHSIRMYQLLKQYESIGVRRITVEDLKRMLGLDEGQYKRFNNLRARVIDVAKAELIKHSDIYFDYTLKRKGRFIHTVIFEIHKKQQKRMFDTKEDAARDLGYVETLEKVEHLTKKFEEGVSFTDFQKDKD